MKRILVFVLLLVLLTGIAAAQEDAAADLSAVDPSGQTVVYWHEWDGAQLEAIDQIIASFNENNEYGITVEPVAQGNTGNLGEAVSAGITSGDLPNLVGGFANNAQSYYLEGVSVALDPYVNDPTWGFTEDEQSDIDFELIDSFNRIPNAPFNDQLLAWPIGLSANVLSVNLEMLEELGYDAPPATLEEFREVACGAAELTSADGGDVQGFPIRPSTSDLVSFVAGQGGSIFDPETNTFTLTNEPTLEVLNFFQQLYADGCAYVPDSPFANTADFAFGLNPMAVGSSVGVPFIQADIEESGSGIENWVNTTVPWDGENRSLQLFFRSVIMMTGTPEEQLATWLFIKHLASPESQQIWTELTNYQPYTQAGREALSAEFLEANPQVADVVELLADDSVNKFGTPQLLGFNEAIAPIDELITEVTVNDANVEEAAAEAEAEANELLQESLETLEEAAG